MLSSAVFVFWGIVMLSVGALFLYRQGEERTQFTQSEWRGVLAAVFLILAACSLVKGGYDLKASGRFDPSVVEAAP